MEKKIFDDYLIDKQQIITRKEELDQKRETLKKFEYEPELTKYYQEIKELSIEYDKGY